MAKRFKRLKDLVLLLGMLIGLNSSLFAQNTTMDSLKMEFAKANQDTLRVQLLNEMARQIYRNQPDSAIEIASQGLALATETDYKNGAARAYRIIGQSSSLIGKNDQALDNYQKSLSLSRSIGDSAYVASTINTLGSLYFRMSEYEKAKEQFQIVLSMARQANDLRRMASALNNMGAIAMQQNNTPKALDLFQQAVTIKEKIGNKRSTANSLGNLGNIYSDLGEYERASQYYNRTLKLQIELDDQGGQATTLYNLGAMAIDSSEPEEALSFLHSSLKLKRSLRMACSIGINAVAISQAHFDLNNFDSAAYYSNSNLRRIRRCQDLTQLATAQRILGEVYLKNEDYKSAEAALLESVQVSRKDGNITQLQYAARLLSSLYESQGLYQKALRFHKIYKSAADRELDETQIRQISQLEAQYAFDKERELLELEQQKSRLVFDEELKRQQLIQRSIIGGSVLLVLLAVNFYRSYRQKQRANGLLKNKNKELAELSEFKENLTHMIVHDMKNPLNSVIGLARGEATEKKLHTIGQSGQQMLTMVTNMLDVQKFKEAKVNLNTSPHNFYQLFKEAKVHLELLMHAKNIELKTEIDRDLSVNVDSELIVRVMGNLLSNAIKFSELGGIISVKTEQSNSNELLISITDHGIGLQKEQLAQVFDKYWQGQTQSNQGSSTGLGLTFCKLAVEAHGGTIRATSNPGQFTTFSFSLPIVEISGEVAQPDHSDELEREETLILESDIAILSKYISQLDSLKIHQVGKITQIVRQMDQEDVKSPWKKDLVSAMHQGNQARFDELVEMLR